MRIGWHASRRQASRSVPEQAGARGRGDIQVIFDDLKVKRGRGEVERAMGVRHDVQGQAHEVGALLDGISGRARSHRLKNDQLAALTVHEPEVLRRLDA